jgi:undecaprenyl-diphosphatase
LTEFIPVSSTGHLLIAEHWLKLDEASFFRSDLFNVVVQCGAVLAVLPLFTGRMAMLARWWERPSQVLLAKIAVAFLITAVGGVMLDKMGYELTRNVANVAWALLIGGVLFIVAEVWLRKRTQRAEVTWPSALATAIGQLVAAIFPGASRSGSTIIFSLLCGTNRVAATEFSFLVGIPTLLAAGTLKIYKALHHVGGSVSSENWAMLALGSVVAAAVSFIAVKWLLRYVQSHTFICFGIYRIVFAVILLLCLHRASPLQP